MTRMTKVTVSALAAAIMMMGLVACSSYTPGTPKDNTHDAGIWTDYSKRNTIFGQGGLDLFGSSGNSQSGNALGVNSFLWRASLDTISFMPVASADPFGGVIITDWHTPKETPNERFKLNIYILSRTLRADGVRVAVFRQIKKDGKWVDAAVADGTGSKIEDAILTRARQLRHETLKVSSG